MVPLKRRKTVRNDVNCERNEVIKFPDVVIFLLERRMGASRRAFLTRLGRNKGFRVEDCYSDAVTHVVSENNTGEEVVDWLDRQIPGGWTPRPVHLLDISWFTESMGAARPLDVQDAHRLKVKAVSQAGGGTRTVSPYACGRRTPLQHHNRALTDALEVLAENERFRKPPGSSVATGRPDVLYRPLGFKLGCTPPPRCGKHSQQNRVLWIALQSSQRRLSLYTDYTEAFQLLRLPPFHFSLIKCTTDNLTQRGLQVLALRTRSQREFSSGQGTGVRHYEDLSTPITKEEAHAIGQIVEEAVHTVLPGAELTITGGFRRGKKTGHDVDFLITHPEEGKEVGLLPKVISWLDSQDLLLYHRVKDNTYSESKVQLARSQSSMDHFERCFSIFRLNRPLARPPEPGASSGGTAQESAASGGHCSGEPRSWKAVRVDLVVTPVSQFAFGLLGWTGSQHFERELRRWAGQEKHMTLNSHALYDRTQGSHRAKDHHQTIATSMASSPPLSLSRWLSPLHHRAHTRERYCEPSAPPTESMAIASHEKGEIQAHMPVEYSRGGKRISLHTLEPEIASGTEEEETSGYESEGGQSASPADPPGGSSSSPPTPPGRRPRTAFTSEQISRLERTFKKHAYLGTREKEELCRKLNLSEKQIKNWFQNRRMKLKRTLQDALAQACHVKVASQLLHYPELQAFGPSAYSGYYPNQDSTAAYLPLPGLPYAPSQALGHLSALPLEAQVHPYSVPPFVMPPHSAGTGSPPVMARYHPYAPRY
uniref:Polymerase (DNA directed), mu n=1 Tax=Lepisosteus oculatus TaxID=7918 RepID=W5NDT9_LEPOC